MKSNIINIVVTDKAKYSRENYDYIWRSIKNMRKDLIFELISVRRELHSFAEVGFELPKTKRIIKEFLERKGIKSKFVGKAGVVAEIGNKNGPCVLLRADTDALEIKEESGLEYASSNGYMHACGHDMHTAMLLGAAVMLKENEMSLCGRVKIVFQGAEEILSGAVDMINSGVLDNPKPDAAFMIHVGVGKNMSVGRALIPEEGDAAPHAKYFKITVKGESTHGSTPGAGTDAALIASEIRMKLEEMISNKGKYESYVLTIGKISAGKSAGVIADYGELSGSFRCFEAGLMQDLIFRIKDICKECALKRGGQSNFEITSECPTLSIDGNVSNIITDAAKKVLGENNITTVKPSGGGSEDFAYFSKKVPSAMLLLCAGDGGGYTLHNPRVTFDEEVIGYGAKIYSGVAVDILYKMKNVGK